MEITGAADATAFTICIHSADEYVYTQRLEHTYNLTKSEHFSRKIRFSYIKLRSIFLHKYLTHFSFRLFL